MQRVLEIMRGLQDDMAESKLETPSPGPGAQQEAIVQLRGGVEGPDNRA